jgi:hypothetical protein
VSLIGEGAHNGQKELVMALAGMWKEAQYPVGLHGGAEHGHEDGQHCDGERSLDHIFTSGLFYRDRQNRNDALNCCLPTDAVVVNVCISERKANGKVVV